MTVKRWEELNDHLLSIAEDGGEIGEDNGCYRVDEGAYVREDAYKGSFENDREQATWALICNLQTVSGLSFKDAINKANELDEEAFDALHSELSIDEDACVYYTEGWND